MSPPPGQLTNQQIYSKIGKCSISKLKVSRSLGVQESRSLGVSGSSSPRVPDSRNFESWKIKEVGGIGASL